MFLDRIHATAQRGVILAFAAFLLTVPSAARADGDLEVRRGAVRPPQAPSEAAPAQRPSSDIIVLDPTRPVERRRRVPEEIRPAATGSIAASNPLGAGLRARLVGWFVLGVITAPR